MKTHNFNISSNQLLAITALTFALGWGLSPSYKNKPLLISEPPAQSGFAYRMGLLSSDNQIKPKFTAQAKKSKSKQAKASSASLSNRVRNIDPVLPPKELVKKATDDSKKSTKAADAKKNGKDKKSISTQKVATTHSKTPNTRVTRGNSNSGFTNTIDENWGSPGSVGSTSEQPNPMVAQGLLIDQSNGIAPNTVPNSNDNSTEATADEGKWVQLIQNSPSFETAKQFYNAFVKGEVRAETYYSVAKNFAFEPDQARKQIGLYLLSLDISVGAFVALHEILERDPSLTSQINLVLANYQSERGVAAILSVLNPNGQNSLVQLALRQVQAAIENGSLRPPTLPISSPVTSGRGRSNLAEQLRVRLAALADSELSPEVLSLAQNIELRLRSSSTVAAQERL